MFEGWTPKDFIDLVTNVIAAAAIVAASTPPARDDRLMEQAQQYWKVARRVLNVLGFNFRNAKNRDED